MKVEVAGEELDLLKEGAVYWPQENLLAVADLHCGKASFFRSQGFAVPEGHDDQDGRKLLRILETKEVRSLVVIGDWIHEPIWGMGSLARMVGGFRGLYPEIDIHWVLGNHDRTDGEEVADEQVKVYRGSLRWGPFCFVHDHERSQGGDGFVLCGHTHPVARLSLGGREFRNVRCFHQRKRALVLPAFGDFTGGGRITACEGDRVFAASGGQVCEVTSLVV